MDFLGSSASPRGFLRSTQLGQKIVRFVLKLYEPGAIFGRLIKLRSQVYLNAPNKTKPCEMRDSQSVSMLRSV